ncbi:MAG: ATP-binding protein, partial [Methylococcales bacterium]
EQARRASEEKSTFLANMSHEIRTPMNAIFGFTQLLSDSVTAPVERAWVLSIKKSGQLLLGLINDVLDLSKIEAGKMQLHVQATDLHDIINETVMLFKPMAAEKGIFLTHEIDAAADAPLMLDAQRLRQVLINLLSNAVKYTEHGGVIIKLMLTPAADPKLRDIRLLITDSGVGIDADQIERIFDPFHQAESPDGKVRQGTGLGLSISRRLIDLMNGRIEVNSDLGKGSTFMVEIPNVPVAQTMPVRHELAQANVDFNLLPPLKILVVDDVIWNTEIAAGFLANSHHEVHIANSGLEALASAKTLKPDLVLMDLRMPGMSGYEASDAIRSDPVLQDRNIAIVAVTASSLGDDEKALRESFDGYVRKPYTPIELFGALHSIYCSPEALPEAAKAPGKWTPELRARWRHLQGESLVELRNSMRIREIGDYAQQLHKFAFEAEFELLGSHALVLQRAVQQFDITAVTTALAELAAWPKDFDDA